MKLITSRRSSRFSPPAATRATVRCERSRGCGSIRRPMLIEGGDCGPGDRAGQVGRELTHCNAHRRVRARACRPRMKARRSTAEQIALSRSGSTKARTRRRKRRRPIRAITGRISRQCGQPFRKSQNAAWVRNPVDAFLAAGHESHGLVAGASGGQGDAAAARVSRPDRPAADARRARGVSRRRLAERLRRGRRPAAGQPAVWRALGPALDGRVALQRLGRLQGGNPRQRAAHLAVARLDRRVAQRRQRLRPDGRGDARRRRARADRSRTRCGPPAFWSATGTSSTATPGSRTRSSTRPRRFSASR